MPFNSAGEVSNASDDDEMSSGFHRAVPLGGSGNMGGSRALMPAPGGSGASAGGGAAGAYTRPLSGSTYAHSVGCSGFRVFFVSEMAQVNSSTFRLNSSAFFGIGVNLGVVLGVFRRCLGVLMSIRGCSGCILCQKRLRLS
jgi:hypothetical protein